MKTVCPRCQKLRMRAVKGVITVRNQSIKYFLPRYDAIDIGVFTHFFLVMKRNLAMVASVCAHFLAFFFPCLPGWWRIARVRLGLVFMFFLVWCVLRCATGWTSTTVGRRLMSGSGCQFSALVVGENCRWLDIMVDRLGGVRLSYVCDRYRFCFTSMRTGLVMG